MANKNLFKDKHKKKKNKKDKSKKRGKEKYKAKKKEKRKEKSKDSSYKSDSSASSCLDLKVSLKSETGEKHSEGTNWGFLETVLNDSFVNVKEKKDVSKRPTLEKPGQNIRELNPYWKNGGCGLPSTKNEKETLEQISSSSTGYHGDYLLHKTNPRSHLHPNSDKKNCNFLKPGENSNSNIELSKNIFRGNWKKREMREPEVTTMQKTEPLRNDKDVNPNKSSQLISDEDLNKLAAKLLKAEIMGNTNLINKLKLELEAAKKAKNEASGSKEESKGKSKEVTIVTDRPLKKSYDDNQSQGVSKRQKLVSQEKRISCFANDKYSLQNLFEKEKTSKDDILLLSKLDGRSLEESDEIYLEADASNKMQQKIEEIRRQRELKKAIFKHESLEGCPWCIDNRQSTKHLIVSVGKRCYLCLPEKESLTEGHCLIVPLQHEVSTMHADEDVWDEIKTYQRVLTNMFLEQEQDIVFFENARSFKHFPHSFIQCVPLSKEMGDMAPLYFQKAISDSETEWTNNKKVIDFRQKDLKRSIPKGLPYFAVMFGTSGGFAHIIEDEYLFKRNFAEEVLGGMMDFDPKKWRGQQKDNFKVQRQKALEFLKIWKKFEFNDKPSDYELNSSD